MLRLARGDSYVRPIESARVTARNGGRTLVVDGEIAPSVPLEAMTSNQMIDVNQGIRPDPKTAAVLVQPNADLGILPPPVSAPVPKQIRLLPLEFRRLFQCLGP